MELATLLTLCRRYRDLGSAVQAQLDDVADGAPVEDQNEHAMKMAAKWLREAARHDVDGADDLADTIRDSAASEAA